MTVVDQAGAQRLALKGNLLDFTAKPQWAHLDDGAVRWRPEHWLLIEDGRIVGAQTQDPGEGWLRQDYGQRLLLPGFIDTHVHAPQLEVMASYGTELLDWLQRYTFPAEMRFGDPEVAQEGAERFIQVLLAHGSTSAVVFPTVHKHSAQALFEAARSRGMRLITGKVLMDRHAPDGLRDDVQQAREDCEDLIARYHGVDRLAYAVTVRFAPTSTPEQLAMAGALCRSDASLYMQTHVAENRSECAWVAELFPQARSYLDVYEQAGLLHPRAVMAHGIWLDEQDRAVLRQRGAHVAHCPSSNLFLGSGVFDWRAAHESGLAVSLASDVGAGTSLNLLRNLGDAYKLQALGGQRLSAWVGLHAATLGAAEALSLSHEIGHLSEGTMADVCVWDWSCGAVDAWRQSRAAALHERVFAWMNLADERHLHACYVAGRPVLTPSTPGAAA
ncbi:guanine deaminase [Roseateles sp. BYS180W]|uniref:Guanine deaminase n=1 Tax=Roseateles rivi TaxID=3299028 RepID=A0ABW7FRZ1_9BURK